MLLTEPPAVFFFVLKVTALVYFVAISFARATRREDIFALRILWSVWYRIVVIVVSYI